MKMKQEKLSDLAARDLDSPTGRQAVFEQLTQICEWDEKTIAEKLGVHWSYPYAILTGAKTPSKRLLANFRAEVEKQVLGTDHIIPKDARRAVDRHAEFTLRKISKGIAELPRESQATAAAELANAWSTIRRLVLRAAAGLIVGLPPAVPTRAEASDQPVVASASIVSRPSNIIKFPEVPEVPKRPDFKIPDEIPFFESLHFGYYGDVDPQGVKRLFEEKVTLQFSRAESEAENFKVFIGEGENIKGEKFSLRAERGSDYLFTLRAKRSSAIWWHGSFNRCVGNVLLGHWTGGSNFQQPTVEPFFLSPRDFKPTERLAEHIISALPAAERRAN